jgi:hypothetical protein
MSKKSVATPSYSIDLIALGLLAALVVVLAFPLLSSFDNSPTEVAQKNVNPYDVRSISN